VVHERWQFETAFGLWVVKNRWWIIFATIVFVFATASNRLSILKFNYDGGKLWLKTVRLKARNEKWLLGG